MAYRLQCERLISMSVGYSMVHTRASGIAIPYHTHPANRQRPICTFSYNLARSSVSHSRKPGPAYHSKSQANKPMVKKGKCGPQSSKVSDISSRSSSLKKIHITRHHSLQPHPHPWVISIPIVYIEKNPKKNPLKGNRRNVLSSLLEGLLPVVQVSRQRPISLTDR